MKLSTIIGLVAASASTTLAAPMDADVNGVADMMVHGCQWTIESFSKCTLYSAI